MRNEDRAAVAELGRQISLKRREEILRRVARPGAGEMVRPLARTGFNRREPEALLLVGALQSIATAEAGFALARLAEQSQSERVRRAARSIFDSTSFRGGPRSTLFELISRPPVEQQRIWEQLDPDARRAVLEDVESLWEELDRDKNVVSNAYLRTLHRFVTQLPLLVHAGGELEERSAQRFAQRSDVGESESAVLALMPAERAERFLVSSISGRDPGRARLALETLAGRVDDSGLAGRARRWLLDADDHVAAAALAALLRHRQVRSSQDVKNALNRIERAQAPSRESMVELLLDHADDLPALAAVGIPDPLWGLIHEVARRSDSRRLSVSGVLARELSEAEDPDRLADLAVRLDELRDHDDERVEDAEVLIEASHEVLASRRRHWQALSNALERLAAVATIRAALWEGVVRASGAPRAADSWTRFVEILVGALARAEEPERRLDRLLGLLTSPGTDIALAPAVRLVHEGVVEAERFAREIPDVVVEPALKISSALRDESELESERLARGDQERQQQERERFVSRVLPLVERAIHAARGNERLQFQYRRLIEAFEQADAELAGAGEVRALPAETGSGGSGLRALAKLDRIATGGGDQEARQRRDELLSTMAASGEAEATLRDLFTGGPRQRTAIRLSGDCRDRLLEAAVGAGFRPPEEWLSHPVLGQWLTTRRPRGNGADPPAPGADPRRDLFAELRAGARAAGRLASIRGRRDERRRAVRASIARVVTPVFEELDAVVFGYARVRRALESMGWEPAEQLGSVVPEEGVDPERHEVVGERGPRYVVRSTGVAIDGRPVSRAVLERVEDEVN